MFALVVARESKSKSAPAHCLYAGTSAREARRIYRETTTFPRVELFLNPLPTNHRFPRQPLGFDDQSPPPETEPQTPEDKPKSASKTGKTAKPKGTDDTPKDPAKPVEPAPSNFAAAASGRLPRQETLLTADDDSGPADDRSQQATDSDQG